MARSFRFYEKKRGHRRTGTQFGRVGEMIFFTALVIIGLLGAAGVVLTGVVPEWRANHEFVPHTCIVLDKRLGEREGEEGKLFRPEIRIEYEVGGTTYRRWCYDVREAYAPGRDAQLARLDDFEIGAQEPRSYPCWYDPIDPSMAVVVRGYSWWMWPVSLVWTAFVLTGAGGLLYTWLHWGKSAERRATIAQRVRRPELLLGNDHARPEFPHVPDGGDITNSPGTHLKYRLPIGTSPGWLMFTALVIAIVWNGIVAVWGVWVINDFRMAKPGWQASLLLAIPFAVVGVGLLAWFIRQFLVTTGIGPTHVEISDHPLIPGRSYRLFLSQPGRLTFNRLVVSLVCSEETTFHQGTNTRTENCEVFRQTLLSLEKFDVRPGAPLETDCDFTLPDAAMHSFKAANNAVSWKVVVEGHVAGWPDFTRTFPVILRPRV